MRGSSRNAQARGTQQTGSYYNQRSTPQSQYPSSYQQQPNQSPSYTGAPLSPTPSVTYAEHMLAAYNAYQQNQQQYQQQLAQMQYQQQQAQDLLLQQLYSHQPPQQSRNNNYPNPTSPSSSTSVQPQNYQTTSQYVDYLTQQQQQVQRQQQDQVQNQFFQSNPLAYGTPASQMYSPAMYSPSNQVSHVNVSRNGLNYNY